MSEMIFETHTADMDLNGMQTAERAEDFADEIERLKNEAEQLFTIWTGDAAEGFREQYEQEVVDLKDLCQTLHLIGEAIRKSAADFDSTEEELANNTSHMLDV